MKLLLPLLLILSLNSIADEESEAYFKKFLYTAENTSNDPDFPKYTYRWLMNDGLNWVPTSDGKYTQFQISLGLFGDGKFRLKFSEMKKENLEDVWFDSDGCAIIEGEWQIPEKLLLLDDFAQMDRHFEENQNKTKITFTRAPFSKDVLDMEFVMNYGYANFPITDMKCIWSSPPFED